jgi:hypothetical protein
MPRRKQEVQPVTATDSDPWQAYLEAMHLTGGITVVTQAGKAETFAASEWELQIIKDPLFDKFLRYGPGKTRIGPKTVGEFLSLPPDNKKFYAQVFKEWKKVIKERKIPIEELEQFSEAQT